MSQAATMSDTRAPRMGAAPGPSVAEPRPARLIDLLLARTKVTRIPNRLMDEPFSQERHRLLRVLLLKARRDRVAFLKDEELGQLCGGWTTAKVQRVIREVERDGFFTRGKYDFCGRKERGFAINWVRFGFKEGPKGPCEGGWTPIPNPLITGPLTDELYRCMELIIRYRNKGHGASFPADSTLAKHLDCSRSSVQSYLKRLEGLRYFARVDMPVDRYTYRGFEINWDVAAPAESAAESGSKSTAGPPSRTTSDCSNPGQQPLKAWTDDCSNPGQQPLKAWTDDCSNPGHKENPVFEDTNKTPPRTRTQDAASGPEGGGVRVLEAREEPGPVQGRCGESDSTPVVTSPVTLGQQPAGDRPAVEARTLGSLPIRGRDSDEARALEERVRKEHGPEVAAAARNWCEDIPVEWVDCMLMRRVRDNPNVGSPVAYLNSILHACLTQKKCAAYESAVSSGSAEEGREGETPWQRRKRQKEENEIRAEIAFNPLLAGKSVEEVRKDRAEKFRRFCEGIHEATTGRECQESVAETEADIERRKVREMFAEAGLEEWGRRWGRDAKTVEQARSLIINEQGRLMNLAAMNRERYGPAASQVLIPENY
jgi:hypothetical protein